MSEKIKEIEVILDSSEIEGYGWCGDYIYVENEEIANEIEEYLEKYGKNDMSVEIIVKFNENWGWGRNGGFLIYFKDGYVKEYESLIEVISEQLKNFDLEKI